MPHDMLKFNLVRARVTVAGRVTTVRLAPRPRPSDGGEQR
jgi:hypothetical protein